MKFYDIQSKHAYQNSSHFSFFSAHGGKGILNFIKFYVVKGMSYVTYNIKSNEKLFVTSNALLIKAACCVCGVVSVATQQKKSKNDENK